MTSHDQDLEDILVEESCGKDGDLEDLLSESRDKGDSGQSKTVSSTNREHSSGICAFLYLSIKVFLLTYTKCAKFLFVAMLSIIAYIFLALIVFNPVKRIGEVGYDMTNVQNPIDFDINSIDHWCLDGGDLSCKCDDPLTPLAKLAPQWHKSHKKNIDYIQELSDKTYLPSIDAAFLGGSVVGVWNGMNPINDPYFLDVHQSFQDRFNAEGHKSNEMSSHINAIALGGFGDSAANILWKLNNGYLDNKEFNPYVWWLVVGMDDLSKWKCSEEVVIMGVLRIVEEIRVKRPDAHIVVNSLLPLTQFRENVPTAIDFRDATRPSAISNSQKDGNGRFLGTRKLDAVSSQPILKGNTLTLSAKELEPIVASHKSADKYQKYLEKIKHEQVDPTLHLRHKYHKHDLGLHPNRVPLWSAVAKINEELKSFCNKHLHATFFDATDIFALKMGNDYKLLTTFMSYRGHPTEAGYALWQDKIEKKLKEILPEHPTDEVNYGKQDVDSGEKELEGEQNRDKLVEGNKHEKETNAENEHEKHSEKSDEEVHGEVKNKKDDSVISKKIESDKKNSEGKENHNEDVKDEVDDNEEVIDDGDDDDDGDDKLVEGNKHENETNAENEYKKYSEKTDQEVHEEVKNKKDNSANSKNIELDKKNSEGKENHEVDDNEKAIDDDDGDDKNNENDEKSDQDNQEKTEGKDDA